MTGSEVSDRVEVERLENGALVAQLRTLARRSHGVTADLLVLLAEVDARRLYLGEGYTSAFGFLTAGLGFSESAAYHRIESARAIRVYPQALAYVASGRLHLTGLVLVARAATAETIDALLELCAGRTKVDIERLLAERAAAARAATRGPEAAPVVQPAPLFDFAGGGQVTPRPAAAPPTVTSPAPAGSAPARPAARPEPTSPAAPPSSMRPMSVRMTPRLRSLLERTQALLGHTIPHGDTTDVLEHVLADFVGRAERRRFGAKRPRKPAQASPSTEVTPVEPAAATAGDGSTVDQPNSVPGPAAAAEVKARPPARSRPHIPAQTRRVVFERDAGQCTFVGTGGHRCGATRQLELHHIVPFALEGSDTPGNLTLHCARHNRFVAEREGFGVGGRPRAER